MIESSSVSVRDDLIAERVSSSSFIVVASSVVFGTISIIDLCALFTINSFNKSVKILLPSFSIACFKSARGSSNLSPSVGDSSYSHLLILPNIKLKPLGKLPVLNSRIENSIVFIFDAISSSSKPSLAAFIKVSSTRAITFSTSSGFTPFIPKLKVACNNSSLVPPPVMASPNPLSIKVFTRILLLVPHSNESKIDRVNSSRGVKGLSLRSQFEVTM
mmetsp:Transcript_26383/g.30377  ORF Transcript_26383/g.30377 Transcript_26383/m.30377 type:complete len:217 (-) Transcript_26383:1303-1953(-)